jgi:hypothetical protein
MFSKVVAFIRGEVTSIETILANWINAVKQLEQHAVEKVKEAEAHTLNALHLSQLAQSATLASQKAEAAATQAKAIAEQINTVITTATKA